MSAANYNFNIEQGASFRLSLTYKDSNENIIDITNWCARLIMKTEYKEISKKSLASTKIYSTTNLDYSLYKFYIDGPNGKIVFLLPSDVTNGFDFDTAKYDLELQSPDEFYGDGGNYTIRLLYGVITINKRNSGSNVALDCQ
jgi:hypothetical protein